jgi:hypothetical protein
LAFAVVFFDVVDIAQFVSFVTIVSENAALNATLLALPGNAVVLSALLCAIRQIGLIVY